MSKQTCPSTAENSNLFTIMNQPSANNDFRRVKSINRSYHKRPLSSRLRISKNFKKYSLSVAIDKDHAHEELMQLKQ